MEVISVEVNCVGASNQVLTAKQRELLKELYPYPGWMYPLAKGVRKLLQDEIGLSEEQIKEVEFITNHDGHGNQWGVVVYGRVIIAHFGHDHWGGPLTRAHLEGGLCSHSYRRLKDWEEKRDRVFKLTASGLSGALFGSFIISLMHQGPSGWIGIVGTLAVLICVYLVHTFAFRKEREAEFGRLNFLKSVALENAHA